MERFAALQQFFGIGRLVLVYIIIRVRVCGVFARCMCCIFCIFSAVDDVFIGEGDSCGIGEVEHCAQMHVAMFRGECVGEYPFGVFALILGGP